MHLEAYIPILCVYPKHEHHIKNCSLANEVTKLKFRIIIIIIIIIIAFNRLLSSISQLCVCLFKPESFSFLILIIYSAQTY